MPPGVSGRNASQAPFQVVSNGGRLAIDGELVSSRIMRAMRRLRWPAQKQGMIFDIIMHGYTPRHLTSPDQCRCRAEEAAYFTPVRKCRALIVNG